MSAELDSQCVFFDIGTQFGYFIEFALQAGVTPSNIHSFEAKSARHRHLLSKYSNKVNISGKRVGSEDNDKSIKIDTYSMAYEYPDIIKIDVEGAEGAVLDGMSEVLADIGPKLFIEIHPNKMTDFGYSERDVQNKLFSEGYHIEVIDHRNDKSEWEVISEYSKFPSDTYLLYASKSQP